MFKKSLLNFKAADTLLICAIFFFIFAGYQHACLVIECNRLNTQIETMMTEKARLQSFINRQGAD